MIWISPDLSSQTPVQTYPCNPSCTGGTSPCTQSLSLFGGATFSTSGNRWFLGLRLEQWQQPPSPDRRVMPCPETITLPPRPQLFSSHGNSRCFYFISPSRCQELERESLLLLHFVYTVLARALLVSMTAPTLRLLLAWIFCIKTHASTPANIPVAANIPSVSLAGALSRLSSYTTSSPCLLSSERSVLEHDVLPMAHQQYLPRHGNHSELFHLSA